MKPKNDRDETQRLLSLAEAGHEISNHLGAILGWTELAKKLPHVPPNVAEALYHVERSAKAAHVLARKFLSTAEDADASDPAPHYRSTVHVSELLYEVSERAAPYAQKQQITLKTTLAPQLWVGGTHEALWSVVWNLTKNALEASSNGGELHIAATRENDEVVIAVRDHGLGMTDDMRQQIFDPYFTTKPHGSGLGLSVVRKTVNSLGGRLSVQSEHGKGSTFEVRLPSIEQQQNQSKHVSSGPPSGITLSLRNKVVLVVDDEPSVRELVRTTLELRGAHVVAIGHPAAASSLPGKFDIAIVDWTLGDTRGDELLHDLRVRGIVDVGIIVSGREPPAALAHGGRPNAWLRKPFELDRLIDTVADLLNDDRRSQVKRLA
jgi:CheY-like chemotaxis protein